MIMKNNSMTKTLVDHPVHDNTHNRTLKSDNCISDNND